MGTVLKLEPGHLFFRDYHSRRLPSVERVLCVADPTAPTLCCIEILVSIGRVTATLNEKQVCQDAAVETPTEFGTFHRSIPTDNELQALCAAWNDPDMPPWAWWSRLWVGWMAPAERERLRTALRTTVAGWRATVGAPGAFHETRLPSRIGEWMRQIVDPENLFPRR